MKNVKEIMNPFPKCCGQNEALQSAARIMLRYNIGSVPVVGVSNKVVGMLTDRDICLAFAREDKRPLTAFFVKDAMSTQVVTCSTEDTLEAALKIMRMNKVGRLPVVDEEQELRGIITLNSILNKVYDTEEKEIQYAGTENVIRTLHAIAERNEQELAAV